MAVKGIKQEIKIKQNIDIINATHFIYMNRKYRRGMGRSRYLLTNNTKTFMDEFIQHNESFSDKEKITINEINSYLTQHITRSKIHDLFNINPKNLQQSSRVINWLWGYIQLNFDHEIIYIGERLDDNEFYTKNEDEILHLSNLIISREANDYFNKKSNKLDSKLDQVINFINYKCLLFDVIDNYLTELHDELIKTDDIKKEIGIFEHCTVNDSTALSQAILDLLNSNLEQQAIISKISKKWSSKKNRHNGKVSFSTTMLPETKNKLEQIVNHSYSNISTTLQKIIDQEHKRLFKTVK